MWAYSICQNSALFYFMSFQHLGIFILPFQCMSAKFLIDLGPDFICKSYEKDYENWVIILLSVWPLVSITVWTFVIFFNCGHKKTVFRNLEMFSKRSVILWSHRLCPYQMGHSPTPPQCCCFPFPFQAISLRILNWMAFRKKSFNSFLLSSQYVI